MFLLLLSSVITSQFLLRFNRIFESQSSFHPNFSCFWCLAAHLCRKTGFWLYYLSSSLFILVLFYLIIGWYWYFFLFLVWFFQSFISNLIFFNNSIYSVFWRIILWNPVIMKRYMRPDICRCGLNRFFLRQGKGFGVLQKSGFIPGCIAAFHNTVDIL